MNKIKVSDKNEATRSPFWIIIDPDKNLHLGSEGIHNIASMITGVWFSRESAEEFLNRTRYNFSKHAAVYCHSGCYSDEWGEAIKNGEKEDKMKFIVTRTSPYSRDEKPCEEAINESVENWDVRTCSENEWNKEHSLSEGNWRDKGKNHKTLKNGWIARQIENRDAWVLEINTLEPLIGFIIKYGDIKIIKPEVESQCFEIRIYDEKE